MEVKQLGTMKFKEYLHVIYPCHIPSLYNFKYFTASHVGITEVAITVNKIYNSFSHGF